MGGNPKDTEESRDKLPPSGCDNPDLGGTPNLQEEKANINEEDELSAAVTGQSQTPVRCVTHYEQFFEMMGLYVRAMGRFWTSLNAVVIWRVTQRTGLAI